VPTEKHARRNAQVGAPFHDSSARTGPTTPTAAEKPMFMKENSSTTPHTQRLAVNSRQPSRRSVSTELVASTRPRARSPSSQISVAESRNVNESTTSAGPAPMVATSRPPSAVPRIPATLVDRRRSAFSDCRSSGSPTSEGTRPAYAG
jgi:hypothetical protein